MNTSDDSDQKNPFGKAHDYEDSELAAKVEYLETELGQTKQRLNEERFLFVLAALFFLDAHIFGSYDTWTAPLTLFGLQLIFIVIVAEVLYIKIFTTWLRQVLDSWRSNNSE